MKIIRLVLIFILFVTNLIFGQSKDLEIIIQDIKRANVVEYANVGDGSLIDSNGDIIESENYKNYKKLKAIASFGDLLKLTNHENATVACYAGWALSDTSYFDLKSILQKFIKNDREIVSYSGCNKSLEKISVELYHRYWNNVDISIRQNDKLLFELDSTILYSKNSDLLLLFRALNNRIYDDKFNSQIKNLALKKENEDAILYLNKITKSHVLDSSFLNNRNINELNIKASINKLSSIDTIFISIHNIKKIFGNYVKYNESTDSPGNKDLMNSCLKSLNKVNNPDDLELLINVWMYYDPTDFPSRELVLIVLNKNKLESIEAVKKRMRHKKKWETENVAPFSELKDLLSILNKL